MKECDKYYEMLSVCIDELPLKKRTQCIALVLYLLNKEGRSEDEQKHATMKFFKGEAVPSGFDAEVDAMNERSRQVKYYLTRKFNDMSRSKERDYAVFIIKAKHKEKVVKLLESL